MSELRELSSRLDFFLAAPLPVKDVGDLFHCSLHVIKAFYKRDRILKGGFCEFAANYGHLDALKWGHKKGFPIELGTWVNALSQPRILEWLVDTLEVQAVFLHAIVERDLPDVVDKMMAKLHMEWTHELTVIALKAGAFNVLERMRKQGKFDELEASAISDNGCSVGASNLCQSETQAQSPKRFEPAAKERHLKMRESKMPGVYREDEDGLALRRDDYTKFVCLGVFDVKGEVYWPLTPALLKICEEYGFEYVGEPVVVPDAPKSSPFPAHMPQTVRDWVTVHGRPGPGQAPFIAKRGRLDVMEWFYPNSRGCGPKTWYKAVKKEHVDILHWLYQCRPDDFDREIVIKMARKHDLKNILRCYGL